MRPSVAGGRGSSSTDPERSRVPWVPQRVRIELHAGRELRADTPWLVALSGAERRRLFEEIKCG
jgi:hypothetical protein